jgi:hypothetical protein
MIKRLPMIVANDSSVRFITFFIFCSSQETSLFILVNRAIRTELTIPFYNLHPYITVIYIGSYENQMHL